MSTKSKGSSSTATRKKTSKKEEEASAAGVDKDGVDVESVGASSSSSATPRKKGSSSSSSSRKSKALLPYPLPPLELRIDPNIISADLFDNVLMLDVQRNDHNDSYGVIKTFLQQVDETIVEFDQLFNQKKMEDLSRRGHFLKGSSATLGIKKIRLDCEKIQHYASYKDLDGTRALTSPEAESMLETVLSELKDHWAEARRHLQYLYAEFELIDEINAAAAAAAAATGGKSGRERTKAVSKRKRNEQ